MNNHLDNLQSIFKTMHHDSSNKTFSGINFKYRNYPCITLSISYSQLKEIW